MFTKRTTIILFAGSILIGPNTFSFEAGYSKGFYLKSHDERYYLKTKARGQFQGFLRSEDWHNERAGFEIRRARLYFEGNVFSKNLSYDIQLTLEGKGVSLRDFVIEYPIFEKVVLLKAGQYKLPYNREFITSSASLELIERSVSNEYFFAGRDIGLSLAGGIISDMVRYTVGIFNGGGRNAKPRDTSPLIAGRLVLASRDNPEKDIWKPIEGAFEEGLSWSAGLSSLYIKYKDMEELSKDRKDVSELSRFMEPLTTATRLYLFQQSGDITLKYARIAFEGEANLGKESFNNRKATGLRAQISGFILPRKLQLAVRYSMVDPSLKDSNDKIYEITGGISWYISESHWIKLQNDYTYCIYDNPSKGDEFIIRSQFQFYI